MTATDALQDCLAAEHAAIYGYGVLGGVLAGTAAAEDQTQAQAGYDAHMRSRDDLRERIAVLGDQPVAAEPVYALPFAVGEPAACRRLAIELESRTAAVYAAAVGSTVDELRAVTARALTGCAVRSDAWGAPDDVLPGLDEL